MTDKFKDKYRTETTRLKGWNYASTGYYFVTICEKNRSFVFGDIYDGTVTLTPLGQAAIECWAKIPEHFPFVELDAYCVMPNHIHGIIVINPDDFVETQDFASLQCDGSANKFGPQSRNLASIVRGFKIGVTKYSHANDIDFAWQPRYHDRIIRDEQELFAVRTYIHNNPLEWVSDEYSDGGDVVDCRDAADCRDAKSCVSTDGKDAADCRDAKSCVSTRISFHSFRSIPKQV